MLYKNNPKSFVKITPFTLVLLGAGLLLFQPLRSSAQIYFNGGMQDNGSAGLAGDTLSVNAIQNSAGGFTYSGQVTSDPTLAINNSIGNTSSFAWTEYLVNVSMYQSFSISLPTVTPADWTANITQPGAPVDGTYAGTIDYLAGTPVPIGGTLDFGFTLTFGSDNFNLSEMATPVPEPSAFGFLLVGGLLLGGWMLARRQHA